MLSDAKKFMMNFEDKDRKPLVVVRFLWMFLISQTSFLSEYLVLHHGLLTSCYEFLHNDFHCKGKH